MTIYELDALNRYQTDKLGNGTENPHDYGKAFEFHFGPLRDRPLVFWEIGVDRGDSLRMWSDYFPQAQIVGIDIRPPTLPNWTPPPRCEFRLLDCVDRPGVWKLAEEYPPDIVLDDGSHLASDLHLTFDLIWPLTKVLYVIEDLGTQYPDLHRGKFVDAEPFTYRLKRMCDLLARMEGGAPQRVCWEPGQVYLYK